jgi:hypothetical protein
MHPSTRLRFIDAEIGHGVFATELIPRGTITWTLDEFDQVLAPERVLSLPAISRDVVEKYAYVDTDGNYVLCWDLARYVNHACEPTSRGIGPDIEIAVRDILPGEQLTSDYAELNVTATFRCACGHRHCRGEVSPDDVRRHCREWDALAGAAFSLLKQVAQPLWPLVRDKLRVEEMLSGREPVPSRLDYLTPREGRRSDSSGRHLSLIAGGPPC